MKYTLFILLLSSSLITQQIYPSIGKIIKYDNELFNLIDLNAKIEVVASGFDWSEGPVWIKKGNYLLFSDVPNNTIFKWNPLNGETSVFLKPSGFTGAPSTGKEQGSNGIIVNNKGNLVMCEHGDRRVSEMPISGGGKVTLTDRYNGKRFNSPNDVIQSSYGTYFFSDPPYGLPKQDKDSTRELNITGLFQLENGIVKLIDDQLTKPNGLALSPDEKYLYVAQSDPENAIWKIYTKDKNGYSNGKVFYDATQIVKQGKIGLPDGMKIDKKGNIFATGPGGVFIFNSKGILLGVIETGVANSNCAWSDDGSTLYITSDMYITRVKTKSIGLGF